jgi:hypothetical protein
MEVKLRELLLTLLRKLGCDIDDGASPQTILEALTKFIQSGKTSWRPEGFAWKHSVSASFIYNEIRDKRLRARKPRDGVTIITSEDEADWLDSMPVIGAPKPDAAESTRLSAMRTIGEPKPDAAESIEPTESESGAKARAGPS